MSVNTKRFVVQPDTDIDDVDLDEEEVRLRDGRRLTNQLAEELAERALVEARRRNLVPGRKSLTGGSTHSPRVQFRVPADLRAKAERRAAEKGVSLSELAREALEDYLAS